MILGEWIAVKLGYAVLLGGMVLGACAGCWEEIEYTGPPPGEARRRAATAAQERATVQRPVEAPPVAEVAPSRADADATNFGEDLAESLPKPAPASSESDPDLAAEPAASAPTTEVDRYAMPQSETSANYAPAGGYEKDQQARATGTLTAATLDGPTADAVGDELPNTELAAWQLGSKLTLAALAHDRGVAAESVQQWVADCKSLAASLGTETADLPAPAAADEGQATSQQVLAFLLQQGRQIAHDLARQHGRRHPALFEVAMKANLLRVLYEPGSTATEKLSSSIAEAAQRADLPAEFWQPLLDALASKSEIAEVRKAVQRLHAQVERHLAEKVEH